MKCHMNSRSRFTRDTDDTCVKCQILTEDKTTINALSTVRENTCKHSMKIVFKSIKH